MGAVKSTSQGWGGAGRSMSLKESFSEEMVSELSLKRVSI